MHHSLLVQVRNSAGNLTKKKFHFLFRNLGGRSDALGQIAASHIFEYYKDVGAVFNHIPDLNNEWLSKLNNQLILAKKRLRNLHDPVPSRF